MDEAHLDSFAGKGFDFNAREARAALMKMTASGTMVKPEKQPLPISYSGAAACRYFFVERARGIVIVSFLGRVKDPSSKGFLFSCYSSGHSRFVYVRKKVISSLRSARRLLRVVASVSAFSGAARFIGDGVISWFRRDE